MNRDDLKIHRREYLADTLMEEGLDSSPFSQFSAWFSDAEKAGVVEPNACALATVSKSGSPGLRMVLIKEFDREGFIFYTNYESRKGTEIEESGRVALLFYWSSLERQVRIEGSCRKIPAEKSDAYFKTRPVAARIAATLSPQSRILKSRAELDEPFKLALENYNEESILRPSNWGGYRVSADYFEFWQGRESRLHDRISYSNNGDAWEINRLAP